MRIKLGFRRFLCSQQGNIAIISALMMPVIVGFCGIAGESTYWYYRHRDIQGAADIAAFSGVAALRSGASTSAVMSASTTAAASNGWRQSNGTIQVNTPPTSGAYQNNNSVQVILTENETRYFTRIFNGTAPVPISVRATATMLSAGPACILGLNNTASGTVEFWGNSTANFSACNVATNSNNATGFKQGGSSTIWVPCVYSSGGEQHTSGLHLTSCGSVVEHHPKTPDPYANLNVPNYNAASCLNLPNTFTTLTAGACYNGMDFKNNIVTIPSGTYVVNGGSFKLGANAVITGSNVTFILTGGAVMDVQGTSKMTLSAPSSGTYAGVVFYGDRTQAWADNKLNGTNDTSVTGAVYFPSQKVSFQGNFTGTNGCMQVVADTIYYTGNGTFNNNCSAYGMKTIQTPGAVTLAE